MISNTYIIKGKDLDVDSMSSVFSDLVDYSFVSSGIFGKDLYYSESFILNSEAFYYPKNQILKINSEKVNFLEVLIKAKIIQKDLKITLKKIN